MSSLLIELQERLEQVLLARAQKHTELCGRESNDCLFENAASEPNSWLAQGTRHILIFPSDDEATVVHRFGFSVYDSEDMAKAHVRWANAMQDSDIGAGKDSVYSEVEQRELKAFVSFLQRLPLEHRQLKMSADTSSVLGGTCKVRLETDRACLLAKADKAIRSPLQSPGGKRRVYLFRDRAAYAESNLLVWLVRNEGKHEILLSAWRAMYATIKGYARLFRELLISDPKADAVVVDQFPTDFLVYDKKRDVTRICVLFRSASLTKEEARSDSPASELSQWSLELLSDQTGPSPGGTIWLSVGVFVTLLANSKGGLSSSPGTFQAGVQVLQEILSRASTDHGIALSELLKDAMVLVASLRFQARASYSFLTILGHRLSQASKPGLPVGPKAPATSSSSGSPALTSAIERYLGLLPSVFACSKCGKPAGDFDRLIQGLQAEAERHSALGWLTTSDFEDALYNKLMRASSGEGKAEVLDGRLLLWQQDGHRRTDIVTCCLIPHHEMQDSAGYLSWTEALYASRIGACESVRLASIAENSKLANKLLKALKQTKARRTGLRASTSPAFSRLLGERKQRVYLACYSQANDNGSLTEYLTDHEVAREAWPKLFELMQRYARLLCQRAQTSEPLLLFGRWDTSHVAVYRCRVRGRELVEVRLWEPLLLAQQPLSFPEPTTLDGAVRLGAGAAGGEALRDGLAVLFYLTLLANGTQYFPSEVIDNKDSRDCALAPLIRALSDSVVGEFWEALLRQARDLAAMLGIASEHGLTRLTLIGALANQPRRAPSTPGAVLRVFWKNQKLGGPPWNGN